ncbi:MAG TPA: rod shape-determining protein MreC [Bryobacteraceae bacterium]|jgi:rod shape-determining protein MreC
METFLNRYRNVTVLLLVIFAQLVLLAVQVKNDQDVRIIRVWTVSAITPAARVMEWLRGGSIGFVRNYILLHDTQEANRRLAEQVERLKIENNFLRNELNTADRAKALALFQAHTPSRTLAANVIGTGAGSNSKVVFVDRGSSAGVERGMAVVTPDGIVGKVIAAYPTASEVLLITDPDFAAGVISQKTMVRGTLKGQGTPMCKVDYVPTEEKLQVGDWFYTSGDDRVFPRGLPVGVVKIVRPGQPFQEIYVEPSGIQRGLEDVLIVIEGVHQVIPNEPPSGQPVYIAPPAPDLQAAAPTTMAETAADKLRAQYKAIGDAQNHKFGESGVGEKPANFNLKPPPAGSNQASAAKDQAKPAVPAKPAGVQPPIPSPQSPAPAPGPRPTAAAKQPPATAKQPQAPAPPPPVTDDVAQRPHSE